MYYIIVDYSASPNCYLKAVDTLGKFAIWTEEIGEALTFPTGYHAYDYIVSEVQKVGFPNCRVLEVYDQGG